MVEGGAIYRKNERKEGEDEGREVGAAMPNVGEDDGVEGQ